MGEAIESYYIAWKPEQHRLIPKYYNPHSFVLLVKQYHVTYEDDDKPFKITCQYCNGFVICSSNSVEILYINFIHSGESTIGIYPEDLDTDNFYFQWPGRTKTQHIYHSTFKEGNIYHR